MDPHTPPTYNGDYTKEERASGRQAWRNAISDYIPTAPKDLVLRSRNVCLPLQNIERVQSVSSRVDDSVPSFNDMVQPVTINSSKVTADFDKTSPSAAPSMLRKHSGNMMSICGYISQYGMLILGAVLVLIAVMYLIKQK